jgi:HIRAN domain
MPNIQWSSKLRGVTYAPDYPASLHRLQAQLIVARSENRSLVVDLVRDPGNPDDCNAISVRVAGAHIGWVPAPIAAKFAPQLDRGERWRATVGEVVVTPQRDDQPGVIISFTPALVTV